MATRRADWMGGEGGGYLAPAGALSGSMCRAGVALAPFPIRYRPSARTTGGAMGIKLQGVGGGGTGEPIKPQGFAGSHTRPARPPEAKLRRTAGGLHFFGGELR
jgi:hypothetical protein